MSFIDNQAVESDVSEDQTWKKVEEIVAKPSSKKKIFRDFTDVSAYHKHTGRWPVVRKVKAKSEDPKDDTFELVKGFKDLAEARKFISSPDGYRSSDPETQKRLSYLLWYLPEECM